MTIQKNCEFWNAIIRTQDPTKTIKEQISRALRHDIRLYICVAMTKEGKKRIDETVLASVTITLLASKAVESCFRNAVMQIVAMH